MAFDSVEKATPMHRGVDDRHVCQIGDVCFPDVVLHLNLMLWEPSSDDLHPAYQQEL